MQITIRCATTDDAEAISAIWKVVCAERVFTAVNRPFTPQQERDYIASLSDREGIFLAEVDGRIVGFQSLDLWAKYTDSFDHVGLMGHFRPSRLATEGYRLPSGRAHSGLCPRQRLREGGHLRAGGQRQRSSLLPQPGLYPQGRP